MPNLRPILLVTGALVAILGASMLVPMTADLFSSDPADQRNWTAFGASALISIFVGAGIAAATWGPIEEITIRQGFLLTVSSWVALVIFAALPLKLGVLELSYTNAFFEAMSGITTTGSTVITGLDDAPAGILLWRSMLEWFGGVGIIIMAFAVMPALRVGGMQVFKSEAWDTSEKFVANAANYSLYLTLIYAFFTTLCFLLLWAFGMTPFDAINHAMTTVATGGFSTKDASLGAFLDDGTPIDLVVCVFMIIGSLPFGIFLGALIRGEVSRLVNDSQIRFFIGTITILTLIMVFYVYARFDVTPFTAFRLAFFNVVSVLTGTGFATAPYDSFGGFAIGFFFCTMFIGGCAGSTSCGLKIFRFQVALAAMRLYAKKLAHPRGVFVARYNGRPLDNDVFVSVLSFFFVYFAGFATLALLLSSYGLDPLTAISSAATSVANVGPGLGPIVGPSGNFASIPDGAKWLMSAGMLFGRLEFFTLLVILTPGFWHR